MAFSWPLLISRADTVDWVSRAVASAGTVTPWGGRHGVPQLRWLKSGCLQSWPLLKVPRETLCLSSVVAHHPRPRPGPVAV